MFKKIKSGFDNACNAIKGFFVQRDMPVAGEVAVSITRGLLLVVPMAFMMPSTPVALGIAGVLYASAIGVTAGVETVSARIQKSITKGTRNEAGQTIVGSVYDLKRLAKAQAEITAISSTFNGAAADREQQIANVIATVEPLRTKVQVFDAGSLHASNDKYDFKI